MRLSGHLQILVMPYVGKDFLGLVETLGAMVLRLEQADRTVTTTKNEC